MSEAVGNAGTITTGDGCTLAWRSDGAETASVLILSNSLGCSMDMWEAQIPVLSRDFRVIRYDTRGHGQSDVPEGGYSLDRLGRDVIELADALDIDRFAFCGVSLGGMTGQWLGVRAPERLTKLVIANSSPYMGPPSGWDARIATVLEQGVPAIADAVVERWFTPEFRERKSDVAPYLQQLLNTDAKGYAGCSAGIRDMDMRRLLGLVETETLIIGGTRDPATPPEHSELLTQSIAGAQCVMLDAAHLSNIEQPDAFSAALVNFLG